MSKKIIAVTACPTGIAHTYMAAEKLELAAKKLGVEIKVETNGSGGIKNLLTKEDIDSAHAIIVAADTKVKMDRFQGKHLIQVPVSDGIHRAEELINKALEQDAPIYQAKNETRKDDGDNRVGIYKHLMNGVTQMLPFVVAGGLLIALSFIFDYNNAGQSNYGSGNEIARFFNQLGGGAFAFMLPVLAGYIAYSMADRPGLVVGFVGGFLANSPISIFGINTEGIGSGFLGALAAGFLAGYIMQLLKKIFGYLPKALEGIKPVLLYPLFGVFLIGIVMVFINYFMAPINEGLMNFLESISGANALLFGLIIGGMMAIDMGGPINKAAYVFGTLTLIGGKSTDIMAAVMAGGMIPPLGIALATTLFPNKFTKQQIETGKSNYVMGLSFITEGAIPYAAANPKRVLPAIIAGSALAGGLSMLFRVTSPAPHGGIFVLFLMKNWYLYLIALAAGTLLTAFLLKVLLPNQEG